MSNLPTNYVDDVLNANVNTRRKYQMIQNSDGTVSFNDVTDYDTVGSSIGAAQINAQNTKINQNSSAISTLNSDLSELERRGFMPILDFANPLHSFGAGNLSYTATKECYLLGNLSNLNNANASTITINGTPVYSLNGSGGGHEMCTIPLTKLNANDVVTVSGSFTVLRVYDVIS